MSGMSSIKKRWAQWSSILLVIIGMVVGIKLLPTGYSEDLSVIGSGNNVVVLIHNKEGVRSLNLMNQVDEIREDYKGRIEFRIAETGTREGGLFAQKHLSSGATLVLLNGDGSVAGKLGLLDSTNKLTNALNQSFGY